MAIRDKQPDADVGRVRVDNDLESLEKRITVSYGRAAKDITTDLDAFLAKFETKDAKKREDVENGLLSEDDYIDWRKRQIFQSDAMKAKIDDLSQRMVNADKQAMAMVNNELPEIYATSYNFGGFRGEMYAKAAGFDYTQFTIINEDAVKTLMTEDPDLIPWKPDVDGRTDKAWNRKHIQNAVEQGIIKGEGMDKISRRLLPVVGMDKTAAIRTARTAVNGVENKGRMDATQRVVDAGIPMVMVWSCTHDSRTRLSHALLDGETIAVGGEFSNGLKYPADPDGDPEEVYNCRCAAIPTLEGIDHSKDDDLYEQFMEDNYYDDWVKVKEDREEKEAQFADRKEKAKEWAGKKQEKALETGVAQDVAPIMKTPEIEPDNLPASTIQVIGEKGEAISPEDLAKNVNPNFPDAGYNDNCQRCVVAYELGRRGYDVEAMAFDGSYLTTQSVLDISAQFKSGQYSGTYITGEAYNPRWANKEYPFNRSAKTTADSVVRAMTDWGDGARGTLEFSWREGGGAHVVNIENINGKVQIIDAQSGMIFDNIEGYLSRAKCAELELRRTDILSIRDNIPPDLLERICKKRG